MKVLPLPTLPHKYIPFSFLCFFRRMFKKVVFFEDDSFDSSAEKLSITLSCSESSVRFFIDW